MRVYMALVFLLFSIPAYANTLYFPQVVNGSGYQTTITISNPGQNTITGTLKFYTPQGGAWSLSINSVTNSQFSFTLSGTGSKRFVTSGTGSIAVGWASVESDDILSGVATYEVRSGTTLTESVGVLGAVSMKRFKVPADIDSSANVGIALINVGESSLKVKLSLANEQGVVTHTSSDPDYQNIPAHGYVAKYANQAFAGLPSTYKGNLIGEVDGNGAMAVVSLILKDGLQSAIPVTDFSPSLLNAQAGWYEFYYSWGNEEWEDYYYMGWMDAPVGYSGPPGMLWGTDDYPDPSYMYWDESRDSWVLVHPVPWYNYNDVYIFNFTSDDTVSGCYYYQDPMDGPLGDCYSLYGDFYID